MNRAANIALLIAVALAAVVLERKFATPEIVEVRPSSTSLEGKVISIDPASSAEQSKLRQARVKLTTGETVRASVPVGCLLFPGQITRLARYGDGSNITYMVTESGRDDS